MSIATTYAKVFCDYVKSTNSNDGSVEAEIKAVQNFVDLLAQSKELRLALFAPMVSSKEKEAVIEKITEKLKTSKLTKNFLIFLIKKRRFNIIEDMFSELDRVRLESEGGLLGEIVTADPIDNKQVDELARAFSKKLNRVVKFNVRTDEQLLAGVKVTVNGVSYDGSLKAQLDNLKERFIQQSNQFH